MKNKMRMLGLVLMLLGLTGCASAEVPPEQMITMAPEYQETTEKSAMNEAGVLVFTFRGEKVIPGEKLPKEVAAAAVTTTQVSSCVGAGTDTLYQYDGFDITVHNGGSNDLVYSVYFLSEDVSTTEGLSIGDSLEKVRELYGEADTQSAYAWVYSDGNVELILMLSESTVVSIEYRMTG